MKRCVHLFTTVFVVWGLSDCAGGGETHGNALFSTVIKEWRRREDCTRSFRFVWKARHFRGAGYQALPQDGEQPARTGDTRVSLTMNQAESGCQAKFETERDFWRASDKRFARGSTIVAFDGSRRWSLAIEGADTFPRGAVGGSSNEDGSVILKNVWFLPLRLMYCPLHKGFGVLDPDQLVLASDSDVVDGRDCLVVSQSDSKGRILKVWVDPNREYVPIQYTKVDRGIPRRHIMIDYVKDPEAIWVPSSWKVDELNLKGKIMESLAAQVVERQINARFTVQDFQVEFPVGTYVRDYEADTTYILREGGERRPVLPGEFTGENYEELLHSDPPSSGRSRLWIVVSVNAVLLALVGTWFFYFRKRRTA